jgi:CubicO group peptidase (beta-lactamase class C family)
LYCAMRTSYDCLNGGLRMRFELTRRAQRQRVGWVLAAVIGGIVSFWSPPLTAAEPSEALPGLEPFVDGIVANAMAQPIAGAAVVVVKDGRILLLKGYGIDSIHPIRAVDPRRSLFRIGSISKTFIWVALMQLAERGKLKLEDPVNDHLPVELAIPREGWRRPIRVIDLMNHTAGFEDAEPEDDPYDDALLRPVNEQLRRFRPRRVREPGELYAYSNYGAALAGAVVAHVAGTDFPSYVERHVLGPLDMEHTSFRVAYGARAPHGLPAALPAWLVSDCARGLEWNEGHWVEIPLRHRLAFAAAGAAWSTAADMARYMLALLEPAQLEHAGVLSQAAYASMTRESFRGAPGLRGVHHGFFNSPPGSRSVLGHFNLSHSGRVPHFASQLSVYPELGTGIFVTTDGSLGNRLAGSLSEPLLARYFPARETAAFAPRAAKQSLQEYAGNYRSTRRAYTKLEAIFSSASVFRVDATPEGFLIWQAGGEPLVRFAMIARDLFQAVNGDNRIAFLRDAHGAVTRLVGAAISCERSGFFDSQVWLVTVFVCGFVVTLGILDGARRRRRQSIVLETRGERRSALLMTVLASVWLAFFAVAGIWDAINGASDWNGLFVDFPQPVVKVALSILLVAAAVTLLALATLLPVWRDRHWSLGRRLRHSVALLVLLALVLTLSHWNAIGFNYF